MPTNYVKLHTRRTCFEGDSDVVPFVVWGGVQSLLQRQVLCYGTGGLIRGTRAMRACCRATGGRQDSAGMSATWRVLSGRRKSSGGWKG